MPFYTSAPPKTGTSAIQSSLGPNRQTLAAHGILYPGRKRDHSATLLALFGEQSGDYVRVKHRTDTLDMSPMSQKRFAAVEEELRQDNWHTLILSTELMYALKRDAVEQVKAWLDRYVNSYQLVAVMRDPVDWAVSTAQQSFKTRGDVEALLAAPRRMRLQQTFARYEEVFGAGDHQVLEFEELVADPSGPGAAFLKRVALCRAAASLPPTAVARNESLSWEAAMMIAELNRSRPFFVDGKRSAARSGAELSAFLGIKGQRFDLPAAVRRQTYDLSRSDVAWLRERFGIDRYDYPIEDLPPSTNPTGISPEFLTAVGHRLADLANEVRVQRVLLLTAELRTQGREREAERLLRRFRMQFPAEVRFRENKHKAAKAAQRARRQ